MAYTFLKSKGLSFGNSLCENDKMIFAKELLKGRKEGRQASSSRWTM
jgi:3-phosphoglycerate kinase